MMWILLGFIVLSILIYCAVEFNFSKVVTRKICSVDEMYEEQFKRGIVNKDKYESLKKENIRITTKDGLLLKGIYIEGDKNLRTIQKVNSPSSIGDGNYLKNQATVEAKSPSEVVNNSIQDDDLNNTIIFVHGITVGIPWSIKYIDMFYKRGWNILIYDQRRHGYSEGKYSTYGFYEKNDLDLWVDWAIKRNGNDCLIGLHGESMGAATVLQYAAINKYAKFIIADCAYSNLNELLKYQLKNQFNLPPFPLLYLTDFKARIRAKFKFKDVSPIDSIRNLEIPIMFIHGSEDKFVPTYMSEKMYKEKKGVKKLYIAEGAAHAISIEVDKDRYEKEVIDFVEDVVSSYK